MLLGYAAGASSAQVEKSFGKYAALAVLAVILVALAMWRMRRHREDSAI